MELLAALIPVLGTALIAFVVYVYKGTISYDLKQFQFGIAVEGDHLIFSDGIRNNVILIEQIFIKNIGFSELNDVTLHLDHSPEPKDISVIGASTMSEASVSANFVQNYIEICIPNMPRNEMITIQSRWINGGYISNYRKLKPAGKKYRVKEWRSIKNVRKGFWWAVKWILLFPLGMGMLVKLLLDTYMRIIHG